MDRNLLTIEELAQQIGVPFYRVAYAHRSGKLPEPPRFGGRRMYDADMAEAVRQHFEAEAAKAVDRLARLKADHQ